NQELLFRERRKENCSAFQLHFTQYQLTPAWCHEHSTAIHAHRSAPSRSVTKSRWYSSVSNNWYCSGSLSVAAIQLPQGPSECAGSLHGRCTTWFTRGLSWCWSLDPSR